MAVRYDIYENPVPNGEEGKRKKLHVRVVTNGTVETEELASKIQESTSLTESDVVGVLSALGHYVEKLLGEGKRIHIEGLGYFQMVLDCDPAETPKEIRAESVHFKSVSFRAESRLKHKLENTKFVRSPRKNHSVKQSDEEIKELLKKHFQDNRHITRAEFQRLCGFTTTTASRRIKKLTAEGVLKQIGAKRFPIYELEG